jgi:hypothetical protein
MTLSFQGMQKDNFSFTFYIMQDTLSNRMVVTGTQ